MLSVTEMKGRTKVLYIKQRAKRLIAAKHADMEQSENKYSAETPPHDQFSKELKRIERRTVGRICAIYPSAFDSDSDKKK